MAKRDRSSASSARKAARETRAELEMLVEMLLLGWVDETGEHRYFERGSREERAARYAVAHLLRNPEPLSFSISNHLARLFDPSTVYAREVTFGFRGEGNRGERLKHHRIALELVRTVRTSGRCRGAVNAAIESAAIKHDLDERTIRRIWSWARKRLE